MGSCRYINPCALVTIREVSFLATDDQTFGETLHERCTINGPSAEYSRFSFAEGEVYSYHSTGDSGLCSENVNENDQQDRVNAWPYSGGVLTEQGLVHIRDLTHMVGECTYHIIGMTNESTLNAVYLAPAGRTCDSGDFRSITCGEGACQSDGVMRCESGEWLEDCTPEPSLSGPDLCDGLDSDCDSVIDEDFIAEETTCGMGGLCGEWAHLMRSRGYSVIHAVDLNPPLGLMRAVMALIKTVMERQTRPLSLASFHAVKVFAVPKVWCSVVKG